MKCNSPREGRQPAHRRGNVKGEGEEKAAQSSGWSEATEVCDTDAEVCAYLSGDVGTTDNQGKYHEENKDKNKLRVKQRE